MNGLNSPIFLLASERSGTNLLRRRFTDSQSVYYGPPPLHFLVHLHNAEPYYGDLNNNNNFLSFISDALGLAYNHFSPWDIHLTVDDVFENYDKIVKGPRTSIGIMHAIYTIYVTRKGYSGYFCKDNNLFDYVEDIRRIIPGAKFIYLYRDPRDVVLSQLKRPLQHKSLTYLSKLWKEEQIRCIRSVVNLRLDNNVSLVSYEDLIENEPRIIGEICDFIGLDARRSTKTEFLEERVDIQEWANLNKATLRDNSGKYKESFSVSSISKIEGICWHQMKWLGYEAENKDRPSVSLVKSKLEEAAAKFISFVRPYIGRKGITKGQIERNYYIRYLQNKWK